MNTQALLFDRSYFNQPAAAQWAAAHGYRPLKYHVTPKYVRARLRQPVSGGHYRTHTFTRGVKAIVGGRVRHSMAMIRGSSAADRARRRRRGGGILDSNPSLIENLITTALAGLAIAGVVKAVKSRK